MKPVPGRRSARGIPNGSGAAANTLCCEKNGPPVKDGPPISLSPAFPYLTVKVLTPSVETPGPT